MKVCLRDRLVGVPSTGECAFRGVRDPPGVVILALPEIPRNAEREQSEGPRQEGVLKGAAKGIIEAETP